MADQYACCRHCKNCKGAAKNHGTPCRVDGCSGSKPVK